MTAANQQITIDEELLQSHVQKLTAATDLLRTAAATAAGGVGSSAFGALCGPLLGPAVDSLAQGSDSALSAATSLADATTSALRSVVEGFSALEDDAESAFRAIEDLL